MDRETMREHVAPCSLLCYTCPGYKDGAIAACARKLCSYFDGYYDFNDAHMPAQHRSRLESFAAFHARLEGYTKRSCPGCRNHPQPGSGCIEGCVIPSCTKAQGIDFCAECRDFPCDRVDAAFGSNAVIRADWLRGSERIRAVGLAQYYDEKKDVSHYISYKKA